MARRERRGRAPETCALCGEAGFVCQSHVIPKFVGEWIKRTSVTGYLVDAMHASKRRQDIHKIRLLCERCEGRFSKHENCFRNEIFEPFEKSESFDKPQSFAYGSSLELFAASLSWRVLKADCGHTRSARPDLAPLIDEAEYRWREFLLGKNPTNPYESHLLFLDGEDSDANSLGGSDWYRFRSVDATLCKSRHRVLAYAKLPHMLIVTSIYPRNMTGWKGTAIRTSGEISTRQSVDDEAFKKFFGNRAQEAMTLSPGPSVEQSRERLEKALEDPQRFYGSESVRLLRKDEEAAMLKKTERMPEKVRWLAERAISRIVDGADTQDGQRVRYDDRRVCSILADLPDDDLQKLERMVETVLGVPGAARKYVRSVWRADSVWISFMVHHDAAKEHERSRIKNEIEDLLRQRGGAETPIGVFSMNFKNSKFSFASAFSGRSWES